MCNVWDQLGPGLSLSHGITWGRFCLSPPDIAPFPVTQEQFALILCSTERSCHQCYTVEVSISCGEMGYADIIPLNVRDMMCKENLWWFRKANIWLRSWDSGGSCEDGLGLSCLLRVMGDPCLSLEQPRDLIISYYCMECGKGHNGTWILCRW